MEVEWLPFELRPAPAALPEPRGEYIRDHWRDHVYGLAQNHGVEIHVPTYQPRSTLALALHSFAEERGRGRVYREAAHHAFFVAGQDLLGDEGVFAGWQRPRASTKRRPRRLRGTWTGSPPCDPWQAPFS